MARGWAPPRTSALATDELRIYRGSAPFPLDSESSKDKGGCGKVRRAQGANEWDGDWRGVEGREEGARGGQGRRGSPWPLLREEREGRREAAAATQQPAVFRATNGRRKSARI